MRGADFEVARGECVGIVGRNGSGKSTLLQMLAGVTAPTEGSVAVRGRVAPLISVGVGFHVELTGRENIYVNGTILGLPRSEIDERLDEIIAFAEIGDFVDTPVKFYSSGMLIRLGFSVAVTAEPDVLLVDEVLAVGDLAFQLKCFERMMEIKDRGTTIVVVSHNLNAIRLMCPRCLVASDGGIRFDGPTDEALSVYHELLGSYRNAGPDSMVRPSTDDDPSARFEQFELIGSDGRSTAHVSTGDEVVFKATLGFQRPVEDPVLNFSLLSESGVLVHAVPRTMEGVRFEAGQRASIEARMRLTLGTGSYTAGVAMVSPERYADLAPSPPSLLFYVSGRPEAKGLVDLGAELSLNENSSVPIASPTDAAAG
jgi:ABC-type polysaccharide/polyol phosphate transport system ATPase subunit